MRPDCPLSRIAREVGRKFNSETRRGQPRRPPWCEGGLWVMASGPEGSPRSPPLHRRVGRWFVWSGWRPDYLLAGPAASLPQRLSEDLKPVGFSMAGGVAVTPAARGRRRLRNRHRDWQCESACSVARAHPSCARLWVHAESFGLPVDAPRSAWAGRSRSSCSSSPRGACAGGGHFLGAGPGRGRDRPCLARQSIMLQPLLVRVGSGQWGARGITAVPGTSIPAGCAPRGYVGGLKQGWAFGVAQPHGGPRSSTSSRTSHRSASSSSSRTTSPTLSKLLALMIGHLLSSA